MVVNGLFRLGFVCHKTLQIRRMSLLLSDPEFTDSIVHSDSDVTEG
jgi:hypothetical protein